MIIRCAIMMRLAVLLGATTMLLGAAVTPATAQLDQLDGDHDSDAPIEITADTLEVRQSENLAIFRGDVDAIQGDMLLRADTLIVHYRDNEAAPDQPGISRIDAEGNVFVSSPNETAQGARGIYDVDNKKIWLTGQVVLTQGENIIQGEQLELDLVTGKSKVLSAESGDGKRERVRGLFVPKKGNN
ncbi:MAG: lipopolysaccharide transport periplasmic protein LptA [Alphaproteobacteria bacterium]|nr:lipopolysaccharide transport periplasmic protein LptA [Alphaproteobacteria bacterium]